MKFFPIYDKIVVKKIDFENKIGELFIPNNESNICKGIVIEIGNGILLQNGILKPLTIKKNDLILFKDGYNVEKYKFENINYYFMKENDIISIIK